MKRWFEMTGFEDKSLKNRFDIFCGKWVYYGHNEWGRKNAPWYVCLFQKVFR